MVDSSAMFYDHVQKNQHRGETPLAAAVRKMSVGTLNHSCHGISMDQHMSTLKRIKRETV